mmetsp:Transcript_5822/g.15069  ORF Transcript_5822/g.15069 Transcript_5822/m.15069 type:complete len:84 (-) Transcript_5822:54-305(-)
MGQDPEKEIKKVTTETNKIVEKNIVKEVNGVPLTPPVIAAIATPVALVALFAGVHYFFGNPKYEPDSDEQEEDGESRDKSSSA